MKKYRIWVDEPGDKWQLNLPDDTDTLWGGEDFPDACDKAIEVLSRSEPGLQDFFNSRGYKRTMYGYSLTPFK